MWESVLTFGTAPCLLLCLVIWCSRHSWAGHCIHGVGKKPQQWIKNTQEVNAASREKSGVWLQCWMSESGCAGSVFPWALPRIHIWEHRLDKFWHWILEAGRVYWYTTAATLSQSVDFFLQIGCSRIWKTSLDWCHLCFTRCSGHTCKWH